MEGSPLLRGKVLAMLAFPETLRFTPARAGKWLSVMKRCQIQRQRKAEIKQLKLVRDR
jgi:hypothetical protein